MSTNIITVLDPTAKSTRKVIEMSVRPNRLEGKVVGLVWNGKPGGDVLLDAFAEQINKTFHLGQVLTHKKPDFALGIAEDFLYELSAKCDFVIVGIGD